MIMSPRYLIAAAVVIAAIGASSSARADARNEVRAVSFAEDGGMTRVHVRGATTPTFTVYKLERPSRVVIDLPQARLAEGLRGHESAATYTANTWAVSTIAAQQLDDGAVRVIVTLARPGRYDVKTDGNEVVVMVMPRDPAPKTANPADLARARAESEQAKKQAQAAEQARVAANTEAERLRKLAADQAAKADAAQRAVDDAKKQLAKNSATAQDLARAQQAAKAAQDEATHAKKLAQTAQVEAERMKLAAEQARRDALAEAQKARNEAAQQQAAATKAREEATQQQHAATKAREEATQQQLAATKAREETARTQAEAKKIKDDVAKAQADAQALVAKSRAEADAAKLEAQVAKADAARARTEAETAKKQAEMSKRDAERMLKDAKSQLATLEQKTLASQQLEDKARATLAAAQAREEAARDSVAKALKEREAAEAAAKQARDASDKAVAADRARLAAEAKAAEARLAKARQATSEADIRRVTAEQAATRARMDLEHTKTALASVEQQRASAVAAATDAARKRSEAEAAASDAARRRNEAEVAASDAARKRKDAETAKDAAERQRQVAETAAQQAMAAKRDAEASLAALNTKRLAAERAANEVAERAKAEGKAQAEMAAAKARKASDDEVAATRREVARLAEERKRAETELADKRKAVAAQQAESTRLATLAAQAKDSAEREESRRTQLVAQRTKEEQELARIKAQKQAHAVQAQVALDHTRTTQTRILPTRTTPAPAPVPVQVKAPPPAPVAAKAPAPAPAKRANVQDIKFKASADTGLVEIAMAGDANVQLGNISASHVELIVDNADIPAKLERTLDVSKLGSPVKKVSSFRDRRTPNRVRLVAELASPAIPTVVRDGNTVRWRFAANHAVAQQTRTTPVRTQSIPPTVVGGFGAASTPVSQQAVSQVPPAPGRGRRVYHGATVEFHFKDAPIHDLLRIIADTGGVNIVVPDTIDAKVTVDMKRVPWDQALEVILASHGLWYRREGNLYRIAPRKELDAEDEAEAARRAAAANSEMPRPEIVTLNYASSDELKTKLESMLSPKGKIEVDGRTNSLIISDIAANRQEIARLAIQLDTQTPQITIEARIVEARSTFVRQFGIQWGGRALMGAAGGNATGLVFPSSIGIRGGNDDNQTRTGGISALPSDFAINLPAATGSGEGGAIGMSLGSVGGNFNINLRLSALEDTGTVRIISAPKITVLNNKAALIRQGVSIPISVVSAAGTQTQFVQADLKLEVTPYVSQRDCAIAMQLDVTKNEPDFVNTGARGDPTILRKEAKTTMLVADGETSVLGGIYTRNTGLAYKKVPFFADLPVIGWFFKSRRENDDRTEILVFITPKITNKASLRCAQ
jgi:type IV pilus assembly protein PilQ